MKAPAPRKKSAASPTATSRKKTAARKVSSKAKKTTASKLSAQYPDIRRALERQRADLLEEVGDALSQHKTPEALPDVSDQASAEEDQRFSMRIMEREQKDRKSTRLNSSH